MRKLKELPNEYQEDIKKAIKILKEDETDRFSQILLKNGNLIRVDNLV